MKPYTTKQLQSILALKDKRVKTADLFETLIMILCIIGAGWFVLSRCMEELARW